jgi:hypothetical protein
LIKTLKKYVPDAHYLVNAVKKDVYKDTLNQPALRNFATHESGVSKRAALKETGLQRIHSSGAWLKRQNRFAGLATKLNSLAADIKKAAPY